MSSPAPNRSTQVASLLFRFVAAGIASWVGWKVGWGSQRWHSTLSLAYVRDLRLPWAAWGALFFLVAALVLCPGQPGWARAARAVGWWVGAVIYGYFALSVIIAVWSGQISANPVLIGAAVGWTVLQVFAATLTMDGD